MKNYLIGILAVGVLFGASVLYKNQNTMTYQKFPVPESLNKNSDEFSIYLFLFFSKESDCLPCVSEIVDIVKTLPSHFCIAGIVPEEELKNEETLKIQTGFSYPLFSFKKFKRYLPWHTPTLFVVSPSGKIICVIPGINNEMDYLGSTLTSIYGKVRLSPSFQNIKNEKSIDM